MISVPPLVVLGGVWYYLLHQGTATQSLWLSLNLLDTYRALRSVRPNGRRIGMKTRQRAMRDALVSWIVFVAIITVGPWVERFISWIPLYRPIRNITSMCFLLTRTSASPSVYHGLIAPLLKRYETPIDLTLLLLHSVIFLAAHYTILLPLDILRAAVAQPHKLVWRVVSSYFTTSRSTRPPSSLPPPQAPDVDEDPWPPASAPQLPLPARSVLKLNAEAAAHSNITAKRAATRQPTNPTIPIPRPGPPPQAPSIHIDFPHQPRFPTPPTLLYPILPSAPTAEPSEPSDPSPAPNGPATPPKRDTLLAVPVAPPTLRRSPRRHAHPPSIPALVTNPPPRPSSPPRPPDNKPSEPSDPPHPPQPSQPSNPPQPSHAGPSRPPAPSVRSGNIPRSTFQTKLPSGKPVKTGQDSSQIPTKAVASAARLKRPASSMTLGGSIERHSTVPSAKPPTSKKVHGAEGSMPRSATISTLHAGRPKSQQSAGVAGSIGPSIVKSTRIDTASQVDKRKGAVAPAPASAAIRSRSARDLARKAVVKDIVEGDRRVVVGTKRPTVADEQSQREVKRKKVGEVGVR